MIPQSRVFHCTDILSNHKLKLQRIMKCNMKYVTEAKAMLLPVVMHTMNTIVAKAMDPTRAKNHSKICRRKKAGEE